VSYLLRVESIEKIMDVLRRSRPSFGKPPFYRIENIEHIKRVCLIIVYGGDYASILFPKRFKRYTCEILRDGGVIDPFERYGGDVVESE
jgi:hypothetical protein